MVKMMVVVKDGQLQTIHDTEVMEICALGITTTCITCVCCYCYSCETAMC